MASLGERSSPRRERLNKQSGEQMNSLLANAFFQVHVGVAGMSTENLAMLRGMEQAGYITPGTDGGGVERKAEKVSLKAEDKEQPMFPEASLDLDSKAFTGPDVEHFKLRDEIEIEGKSWVDRGRELAADSYDNNRGMSRDGFLTSNFSDRADELAEIPDQEYKERWENNRTGMHSAFAEVGATREEIDRVRDERLKYLSAEKEFVRQELANPEVKQKEDKDDLFGPKEMTKEEKVWDKKLEYLADKKILSDSRPDDFRLYADQPEELHRERKSLKQEFDLAARGAIQAGVGMHGLSEKDIADAKRLHEKFGPGNQADDKKDEPKPPKQLSEKQEKIREARMNLHNKFMEQRQNQAAAMAAQWNPDMGAGWGDAFSGQVDPGQALPEAMMRFAKESTNGHEATASTISELALRVRMATQQIWEASR